MLWQTAEKGLKTEGRKDILFEAKTPTSGLYFTGGPEETLLSEGRQECTGEGAPASLRCLVEILLCGHELIAGEMFTELGSLISMKIMTWP